MDRALHRPLFRRSSLAPSSFPTICNIKFRFSLVGEKINLPLARSETELLKDERVGVKHVNNFVVIRDGRIVFTIFHKSGHVNVSGVRDFSKIEEALAIFNRLFKTAVSREKITVDNSTSSGSLFTPLIASSEKIVAVQRLNLKELKNRVESVGGEESTLHLRPHFFPGAVFRRKGKSTLIVFTTGKFIIVGAKNRLQIREAHRALCAITRGMR